MTVQNQGYWTAFLKIILQKGCAQGRKCKVMMNVIENGKINKTIDSMIIIYDVKKIESFPPKSCFLDGDKMSFPK